MPQFIVPRQWSIHRASSIALFRALLSQSRAAPLLETERDGLQHLIRNKFRYNMHLSSWRLLRLAFTAGYEAINVLDSAVTGSESATTQLRSILTSTKPRLLEPPMRRPTKPKNTIAACKPPGQGVLENWTDSTRLAPDGQRRRVPTLVSACRFPMLRFQKPQPKNVSRVLRNKIDQRNKRYLTVMQLEREMVVAEREDAWDRLLARHCRGVDTSEDEARQKELQDPESLRWRYVLRRSIAETKTHIVCSIHKARDDALKMLDIVEREEELTRREKSGVDAQMDGKLREDGNSSMYAKSVIPLPSAVSDAMSAWDRKKAQLGLNAGPRQPKVFDVGIAAPKLETPTHI